MMHAARQRAAYLLADFMSTSVAWFVFNLVRYFTLPYNVGSMTLGTYLSMPMILIGQFVFPLMMVGLFAVSGYYNKVFFKSRLSDLLNAGGVSIIGSIVIFFSALFNDQIDDRLGNFEMILILWSLMAGTVGLVRTIITKRTTQRIWDREIAFNSLIIGDSAKAKQLAKNLEEKHRNMGFRIVGFVSHDELDGIEDMARDLDVQSFIIVPETDNAANTVAIINRLLPLDRSVYITPDTYHLITSRPRTTMVAGQVLIDVSKAAIPESTVNLKRIGDIVASALALVALAPVFAVLAILIKRDSPGPVFYRQERIGYNKKPFMVCKFRSMRVDAEAEGPALSSEGDARVTRLGRVMRKYRIDELPQFWNVLKGEMSLVGPRPERQYYLSQIVARAPYYNLLHQVRPGITSWGMVKYGYASNVDEMLERMQYELLYVENVSFAVDLKILFYTVHTVVTGKGV